MGSLIRSNDQGLGPRLRDLVEALQRIVSSSLLLLKGALIPILHLQHECTKNMSLSNDVETTRKHALNAHPIVAFSIPQELG